MDLLLACCYLRFIMALNIGARASITYACLVFDLMQQTYTELAQPLLRVQKGVCFQLHRNRTQHHSGAHSGS